MTTPLYPFGPAADPAAAKADPRAEAMTRLLGRANLYGDRGDSTETITRILGTPDLDRANRAAGMWSDRTAGLKASGDQYAKEYAAALAASRKSGGGSGRNYAAQQYDPNAMWQEYLASLGLDAPTPFGGATVTPGPSKWRPVVRS